MSIARIWAVFLRYFYFFAKLDHLCDLFYWPALDIFIWGITSVWIQKTEGVPQVALAILTGLVFWQIIWRGNYEVSVNMLQEFWSRNLVNLFCTPLKVGEWIVSLMLLGTVKIIVSLFFGALLVWLLYALNIFTLGWAFLPFAVSLCLSGWFMGFISGGIIIYYGQRVQMLAWMTAYIFALLALFIIPSQPFPLGRKKSLTFCLPLTSSKACARFFTTTPFPCVCWA